MPAQTLYGALDEEAGGGDSQPPYKSYSRLGLVLLAFVLVAAAAVGLDLYCPAGYKCPFNNSDYVSTSSDKSVTSSLSSTEWQCPSNPGLECIEAYEYCTAFCRSGERIPGYGAACSIAFDRCCACGN